MNNTGITYPLLRMASSVGASYQNGWDNVFVVSPDGIVTLKDTRGFDADDVGAEIDALLATVVAAPDRAPDARMQVGLPTPNPFNPRTSLEYRLEGTGSTHVRVEVLDARGRRVATLENGLRERGVPIRVEWNGRDDAGRPMASGVYTFQVLADGTAQVRRGTLVK